MLKEAEVKETAPPPDSEVKLTPLPATVITPPSGWTSLELRELWRYRELLYFLIWREIKVRYKQTVLGAPWAIIKPFVTMVVFSVFFGNLLGVPSDDIPYPIFSYVALVPWNFFAGGMGHAAGSLVGNAHLLTKVYFPRLVIPVAAVLSGLIDFLPAFLVLLGMMLVYGIMPTINMIWLPVFMLPALATALGAGFWLSALNVQFRDVGHIVPFLTQVWLFATPIIYPSSLLTGPLKALYTLNPMVGVVEGFRWALLGTDAPSGSTVLLSGAVALALLVSGAYYFRRMENHFADVV